MPTPTHKQMDAEIKKDPVFATLYARLDEAFQCTNARFIRVAIHAEIEARNERAAVIAEREATRAALIAERKDMQDALHTIATVYTNGELKTLLNHASAKQKHVS